MPDILPVRMQDFLYGRKSELRKYKIKHKLLSRQGSRGVRAAASLYVGRGKFRKRIWIRRK